MTTPMSVFGIAVVPTSLAATLTVLTWRYCQQQILHKKVSPNNTPTVGFSSSPKNNNNNKKKPIEAENDPTVESSSCTDSCSLSDDSTKNETMVTAAAAAAAVVVVDGNHASGTDDQKPCNNDDPHNDNLQFWSVVATPVAEFLDMQSFESFCKALDNDFDEWDDTNTDTTLLGPLYQIELSRRRQQVRGLADKLAQLLTTPDNVVIPNRRRNIMGTLLVGPLSEGEPPQVVLQPSPRDLNMAQHLNDLINDILPVTYWEDDWSYSRLVNLHTGMPNLPPPRGPAFVPPKRVSVEYTLEQLQLDTIFYMSDADMWGSNNDQPHLSVLPTHAQLDFAAHVCEQIEQAAWCAVKNQLDETPRKDRDGLLCDLDCDNVYQEIIEDSGSFASFRNSVQAFLSHVSNMPCTLANGTKGVRMTEAFRLVARNHVRKHPSSKAPFTYVLRVMDGDYGDDVNDSQDHTVENEQDETTLDDEEAEALSALVETIADQVRSSLVERFG